LTCIILLLVLVLAGSAIYNRWAFRHYRAIYPPPGNVYLVDGFNMHLYCTGSDGPTVILEAGAGDDARIWGKVQPEVSKVTRVCSYDRAGFGWSDPRPGLRDSNSIADQLHGLLAAARISGPIVLMGHSIAGLHMRAYLSKYRRDISGVVFVDAATPEGIERMHRIYERLLRQIVWIRPLMTMGAGRLAGKCGSTPPPGMEAYTAWYRADNYCNPSYPTTYAQELEGFEASAREVMHTGPFGDVPFLIFSRDPDVIPSMPPGGAGANDSRLWFSLQEGLKSLSSRARRIVARRSTHYIQIDRAGLLNPEVSVFIRQLRGDAPQPSDYGSTKTE
jgi:pimeloyl-ACP methyl ester carboxylesterase